MISVADNGTVWLLGRDREKLARARISVACATQHANRRVKAFLFLCFELSSRSSWLFVAVNLKARRRICRKA